MLSRLVPVCVLSVCALSTWAVVPAGMAASRPPQQGSKQERGNHVTTVPPKVSNREVSTATDGGRSVLKLDERQGDGVAWWPDVVMGDGTIDVDIRGKDVMQRSFVGVAFHGVDDTTYDAVYFRPFNFKSPDPARVSHAVQYVAHPTFTWSKPRTERPGQFEQKVSPVPDPNGWFHARIEVKFPDVRVFVNGHAQPSLAVQQLSTRKSGWIGLWTGNGSGGEFANLTVVPVR